MTNSPARRLRAAVAFGVASTVMVACGGGSVATERTDGVAPQLPTGHPVVEAPSLDEARSEGPVGSTGVVLETLEGGGYTYALLDLDGVQRWVAGPPIPMEAGDTVSVPDMVSMGAFSSPSLQRSFDELFFTGGFQTTGEGQAPTPDDFQHHGSVTEAIVAGSYVYLAVDTGEETLWIAAPVTEVEQGARVGWNGGSLMKDFTSPSLGRTFAEIFFVEGVFILG